MGTHNKLIMLIDKLKNTQSYCPYCGKEYVCDIDCILNGIWFDTTSNDLENDQ